jgi:protein-tyrosine phosphatase
MSLTTDIGGLPSASATSSAAAPEARPRRARFTRFHLLAAGVLILATAGVLLWYFGGVRGYFVPRNWGVVEPGFYRSGQISRHVIEPTLKKNQVGLVVFMSGDKANRPDVQAEQQVCEKLGIERINCPLAGDGTGDIHSYADALAAVTRARKEGKPVLVHCHTGAQRTGGLVAFYRLLVEKRPAPEVYAELRQYGHDPEDNPELVPYLNAHMPELAKMLVDRGVIDRAPDPLPVITP